MCYLSPEAQKAVDAGAARYHIKLKRMQAGPYLADDGYTLVVPSEWYNTKAAEFWRSHGFHWKSRFATWERDTRKPYEGKRYTAQAWLESTRRKFYSFWPELLPDEKECLLCHEMFKPINEYQIYCVPCEAVVQAERRLHDRNQ